jgi:hypothetical protein
MLGQCAVCRWLRCTCREPTADDVPRTPKRVRLSRDEEILSPSPVSFARHFSDDFLLTDAEGGYSDSDVPSSSSEDCYAAKFTVTVSSREQEVMGEFTNIHGEVVTLWTVPQVVVYCISCIHKLWILQPYNDGYHPEKDGMTSTDKLPWPSSVLVSRVDLERERKECISVQCRCWSAKRVPPPPIVMTTCDDTFNIRWGPDRAVAGKWMKRTTIGGESQYFEALCTKWHIHGKYQPAADRAARSQQ